MKQKIKLIYGIGNEEKKYQNSRHNLGKEISKFYIKNPKYLKFCYFDKYQSLIIATNLVYVNEAGKGIKELLIKFKLKPENVMIIHDDADLLFPLFKTSFNIGSAGHKGIESIIKNLKTNKFWRFRIGIQGKKRLAAEKIVLKNWSQEELKIVKRIKTKFSLIFELLKERLPNELNLKKNFFLNER
ncbi:MAG: peptidyl-tRNA hydrolase [Candidatus Parcubacteria bacterium]|nr:MAG: peptidyl-tRNA hydrolase [Candidatus Parcubacteria bacterium]